MPKNSFLKAVFSGPKFSLSPIEKTNKGTIRIGEIVPVYKTMLMGREKLELELGHLVRFAPTTVPVMEGYEVNFDAFCVPVSALGYAQRKERDIMDFHNLALNDGTVANPLVVNLSGYNKIKYDNTNGISNLLRTGSLGDYLNLPSFKKFRDFVRKWVSRTVLLDGSFVNRFADDVDNPLSSSVSDIADFVARAFVNSRPVVYEGLVDSITIDGTGNGLGSRTYYITVPFCGDSSTLEEYCSATVEELFSSLLTGSYFGIVNTTEEGIIALDVSSGVRSFLGYILDNYPLVASYYGWDSGDNFAATTFFNHLYFLRQAGNLNLNYLDVLYDLYKVDSQSIFDEYFEYVVNSLLYNGKLVLDGDDTKDRFEDMYLPDFRVPIDMTYFSAYWKIISDWYINTNIDGDPNEFFINHCGGVLDSDYYIDTKPFNRRWANDSFTSAVPSNKVVNINIPADGTIPDLREANAYQKLVDILRNTGNRLRDVLYGIRGYRPTADATDMSKPLGTLHSFVGIQSVLQTSATTEKSPLASYSGIGTDSSRGDFRRILKVVNNDEATPVVVMVLMSITQRASYFQGLPRYFSKRSSIYDFAIPQLANIGEQEIMSSELFFDYGVDPETYGSEIFGFNRRYYDWFFEDNEVHGNMRDSEDFWHGAREFSSKPALNSQFIGIDSSLDDLSRIFANVSPSAMPIYYNVYFGGSKVVALPRYIQYDL